MLQSVCTKYIVEMKNKTSNNKNKIQQNTEPFARSVPTHSHARPTHAVKNKLYLHQVYLPK